MENLSFQQIKHYKSLFQEESKFSKYLTPKQLETLLMKIGYSMLREDARRAAKQFIYAHDFSLSGKLYYEDYLEVVGLVEMNVQSVVTSVTDCLEYFSARKAEQYDYDGKRGLTFDDLENILREGPNGLPRSAVREILEDLEKILPKQQSQPVSLISTITELLFSSRPGWTPNSTTSETTSLPPSLNIGIQVISASNLEMFSKTKLLENKLEYSSLDPVVLFHCENVNAETFVATSTVKPEWNEDVNVTIPIPTFQVDEFLKWIEQLSITVALCDYQSFGVVPWTELVAFTSLDIATLLENAVDGSSFPFLLKLEPIFHCKSVILEKEMPHIEVMISLPNSIVKLYHKHFAQIRRDKLKSVPVIKEGICNGLKRRSINEDSGSKATSTGMLGNIYNSGPFNRALLDLPSSSKNLKDKGSRRSSEMPTKNRLSMLRRVSNFESNHGSGNFKAAVTSSRNLSKAREQDESSGWMSRTELLFEHLTRVEKDLQQRFRYRNFQFTARDETSTFRFLPCFVQKYYDCGIREPERIAQCVALITTNPPIPAPGIRRLWCQLIQSPSVTIYTGKGSLVEKSILLCGLLLGLDIDAYVCVGTNQQGLPAIWVVTIEPKDNVEQENTAYIKSVANTDEGVAQAHSIKEEDIEDEEKKEEVNSENDDGDGSFMDSSISDNSENQFDYDIDDSHLDDPVFHPCKFYKAEEVKEMNDYNSKSRIRHWNPEKGTFSENNAESLPYKTANFVFNNSNLWSNVYSSNTLNRVCWNFDFSERWEKLFPSAILKSHGPIDCCYETPNFCMGDPDQDELESKLLLSDLVDSISLYRQHNLYIPNTKFHRKVSKRLLQLIEEFEVRNRNNVTTEEPEGIPSLILDTLPPMTSWDGRMFLFKDIDLESIMSNLEASGFLENSLPDVQYAIGVKCFTKEWGLKAVYVYIGTISNLSNLCLDK